jgi:hypothetical protein
MKSVPLVKQVLGVEDMVRLKKYEITSGQKCQCGKGCLRGFDGPANVARRNVRDQSSEFFFCVRLVLALGAAFASRVGAMWEMDAAHSAACRVCRRSLSCFSHQLVHRYC